MNSARFKCTSQHVYCRHVKHLSSHFIFKQQSSPFLQCTHLSIFPGDLHLRSKNCLHSHVQRVECSRRSSNQQGLGRSAQQRRSLWLHWLPISRETRQWKIKFTNSKDFCMNPSIFLQCFMQKEVNLSPTITKLVSLV